MSISLTVRGQGAHMIVPMLIIGSAALVGPLYYRDHLPEYCIENANVILGFVALIEIAFAVTGFFLSSRSICLSGRTVWYETWFTRRMFDAGSFTHVTLETDTQVFSDSFNTSHYLTLWTSSGDALRLNTMLWNRKGLSAFVGVLASMNPALRVDRDAEPYLPSAI